MEIKNYADIRSLHTKFAKEVEKQTAGLREKLPKSPEELIRAKKTQLETAKKAATKCKRAKGRVLKRFDAEIGNFEGETDRLKGEIRNLEKSLGSNKKPSRKKRKK